MTVQETMFKTVDALIVGGFTAYSAWNEYQSIYGPIERMHQRQEETELNPMLIKEFVKSTEARFNNNEIAKKTAQRLISGAERLLRYNTIGTLEPPRHSTLSKTSDYYDAIIDEFARDEDWNTTSKCLAISDLRVHCGWLLSKGICSFDNVDAEIIKEYMLNCAEKFSPRTLSLIKGRWRRIYEFLFQKGYAQKNFIELFSFFVVLSKPIHPAPSAEDIAETLGLIDRKTSKGKRDYAILLLGIVTGLRACDVVALKLTDVDWMAGEIRLTQKKTGKPLALPLTQDVGEALRDYILNGRLSPLRTYERSYEEIFLTFRSPCAPFKHGLSLSQVMMKYSEDGQIKVGTFHDLRRALGRNLVNAEVPLTTISQVLGHTDPDATKQYISLDSKHLKECAIDFKGITPQGGDAI